MLKSKKLLYKICTIYVDGAYSKDYYSYGMIIHYNCKIEERFGKDDKYLEQRNVAGEVLGAKEAMKYCLSRGIRELILCYDYLGIEMWAIGKWKTNKTLTKEYKAFYDSISDKLRVKFVKVKGHSGNLWNEVADKLAKIALKEEII